MSDPTTEATIDHQGSLLGPSANDRRPIEVRSRADLGALIALAGLPNLTPARLWSLVELDHPAEVWVRVAAGGAPPSGRSRDAATRWAGWSSLIDPEVELARHEQARVQVLPFGHRDYPSALLVDPEPPPVVFRQGPGCCDDRPRVAIVGTRKCSRYGRQIAHHLGSSLASRGVDVVSGLAAGIDGAAHAGALEQRGCHAVAVVAGGVDVVYPACNRGLFQAISERGALLSEWPLGARPARWRFPARNRLVAALSAAVVVVESPPSGGSMYTVDEALARGRAVFAVPGSIHSPVSAGTNKLIADGAHSLHDIDHLLDALAPRRPDPTLTHATDTAPDSWLLEVVGWEPVELDAVVGESGRSVAEVTLEVERLIGGGSLRRIGAVIERVA